MLGALEETDADCICAVQFELCCEIDYVPLDTRNGR